MATLTVKFAGICIHFDSTRNPGLGLPVPYRVVVPRTDGVLQVGGFGLRLDPVLQLPDGRNIGLNGVRMFIDSTLTSSPLVNLTCPPSLTQIWPEMVLNTDVVLNLAPPAAAHFDIAGGNFTHFNQDQSAGAKWEVELESSTAVLKMESSGSVTSIFIGLPNEITINNYSVLVPSVPPPAPIGSIEAELALNFLVAMELPPFPGIASSLNVAIGNIIDCVHALPRFEAGGPGCSNSQFP